jgi:hypothetical protein
MQFVSEGFRVGFDKKLTAYTSCYKSNDDQTAKSSGSAISSCFFAFAFRSLEAAPAAHLRDICRAEAKIQRRKSCKFADNFKAVLVGSAIARWYKLTSPFRHPH